MLRRRPLRDRHRGHEADKEGQPDLRHGRGGDGRGLRGRPLHRSLGWKTASPILLALPDGTLRSDAAEAIKADAGIKRIVIVGGPSVVSDAIKDRLGDGCTYEHLGGADRYETSVQVAVWSAARGLGFSG